MSDYLFSFANYTEMCLAIKSTHRLADYTNVINEGLTKFIIIRHDVEFSPNRAFNLAILENDLDIQSSYFFQVSNNSYNILSKKNIDLLKQIASMGHHVGLHFHLNNKIDLGEITKQILYEVQLLSDYIQIEIDRFSFHRPTPLVLQSNLKIPGLINAYAPQFFTYYENESNKPTSDVKYIADSKNCWQYVSPYSYPSKNFFSQFDRIQILCHPYSWTDTGYMTVDNLKTLIAENRQEFISTLNCETKYVREYLDEL